MDVQEISSAVLNGLPLGTAPDSSSRVVTVSSGVAEQQPLAAFRDAMAPNAQFVAELAELTGNLSDSDVILASRTGTDVRRVTLGTLMAWFQAHYVPAGGLPTLNAADPANVAAGASVTISGTYTGEAPWGLAYSVDGAPFQDAVTPTIGSGNFSFVLSGLTQIYHKVEVVSKSFAAARDTTDYFAVGAAVYVAMPATAEGGAVLTFPGKESVANTLVLAYFLGDTNTIFTAWSNGSPGAAPVSFTASMQVPARPGSYSFGFRSQGGTSVPTDFVATILTTMPASQKISWRNNSSAGSNRARSNPVTFQGYYGGGPLTAIEYNNQTVNANNWRNDATSLVVTPDPDTGGNSGTWSMTIPAPTAADANMGFNQYRFRYAGVAGSASTSLGVTFTS